MVTFEDIQERLGVTRTQIETMIYSGALPPPKDNTWDDDHIEFYIQVWAGRISRQKPKDIFNGNINSSGHTFPTHQR
jgi:hypothetical protein